MTSIQKRQWESIKDLLKEAEYVGTGIKIVEFIYGFGKSDPIEVALTKIHEEIDRIRADLEALNRRLNTVTQRVVKLENRVRIDNLQAMALRLSTLSFQLENSPGDRARAAEAAFEAGAIADSILADKNLWLWSDVRIDTAEDGEPVLTAEDGDFKPSLALPVYSMALMVWVSGMIIETGGARTQVQGKYGVQLERHIAAVAVRRETPSEVRQKKTERERGQRPAEEEEPLWITREIYKRISCEPKAVTKYAENGICKFAVQCNNTITRRRQVIGDGFEREMPPGAAVLCTVDPEVVRFDEEEIQDADEAVLILTRWEEMLRSIAASGHLPGKQFIGQFVMTRAVKVSLYAVDRDLNLDYFVQMLPSTDGTMLYRRRVGWGWNFEAILSGGSCAVLAKQPDGNWLWYWHAGADPIPPTDMWSGPQPVGSWDGSDPQQTKWRHFAGGFGVVYGIVVSDSSGGFTEGDLYWGRLLGYEHGKGEFEPTQRVGNGWTGLSPVFSAGEGVIYGVRPTGVLRWYHHSGWENGADTWDEPRDLDAGVDWRQFDQVTVATEGSIYCVTPNGAMRCYRHLDWRTGGDRFEGPLAITDTWGAFRPLFARQPGREKESPVN